MYLGCTRAMLLFFAFLYIAGVSGCNTGLNLNTLRGPTAVGSLSQIPSQAVGSMVSPCKGEHGQMLDYVFFYLPVGFTGMLGVEGSATNAHQAAVLIGGPCFKPTSQLISSYCIPPTGGQVRATTAHSSTTFFLAVPKTQMDSWTVLFGTARSTPAGILPSPTSPPSTMQPSSPPYSPSSPSPSPPPPPAMCPPLPTVGKNGFYTPRSTMNTFSSIGTTATLDCFSGYQYKNMSNSMTVRCGTMGKWEPNLDATCVQKPCGRPPVSTGGIWRESKCYDSLLPPGTTCTLSCSMTGYAANVSAPLQCEAGKWVYQGQYPPACVLTTAPTCRGSQLAGDKNSNMISNVQVNSKTAAVQGMQMSKLSEVCGSTMKNYVWFSLPATDSGTLVVTPQKGTTDQVAVLVGGPCFQPTNQLILATCLSATSQSTLPIRSRGLYSMTFVAVPVEQSDNFTLTYKTTSSGCKISDWSMWGPCSAKCGGGTHSRSRTVSGPCGTVDTVESSACNTQHCSGCKFFGNCTQCHGKPDGTACHERMPAPGTFITACVKGTCVPNPPYTPVGLQCRCNPKKADIRSRFGYACKLPGSFGYLRSFELEPAQNLQLQFGMGNFKWTGNSTLSGDGGKWLCSEE
eukprot:TRINITY_DN66954_c0_g1_i1.p1 TRINITY_DN66954_c0_g1~~TRINITY_DN66954_c0_g1_i1.p1  ORF type:complete len:627 (-),score=35.30 TRINITY_DN66954_c0_g1_i1:152-2032(-)